VPGPAAAASAALGAARVRGQRGVALRARGPKQGRGRGPQPLVRSRRLRAGPAKSLTHQRGARLRPVAERPGAASCERMKRCQTRIWRVRRTFQAGLLARAVQVQTQDRPPGVRLLARAPVVRSTRPLVSWAQRQARLASPARSGSLRRTLRAEVRPGRVVEVTFF
jgi:hypothetical protein